MLLVLAGSQLALLTLQLRPEVGGSGVRRDLMRSFPGKEQAMRKPQINTEKRDGTTDPQRSESYQREPKELPREGPVESLTFGLVLSGLVS